SMIAMGGKCRMKSAGERRPYVSECSNASDRKRAGPVDRDDTKGSGSSVWFMMAPCFEAWVEQRGGPRKGPRSGPRRERGKSGARKTEAGPSSLARGGGAVVDLFVYLARGIEQQFAHPFGGRRGRRRGERHEREMAECTS